MPLIILPDEEHWIDIPDEGFSIDYGKGDGKKKPMKVIESDISDARVVELLREHDEDDPYTYLPNLD